MLYRRVKTSPKQLLCSPLCPLFFCFQSMIVTLVCDWTYEPCLETHRTQLHTHTHCACTVCLAHHTYIRICVLYCTVRPSHQHTAWYSYLLQGCQNQTIGIISYRGWGRPTKLHDFWNHKFSQPNSTSTIGSDHILGRCPPNIRHF
jgi:hypothetical protein